MNRVLFIFPYTEEKYRINKTTIRRISSAIITLLHYHWKIKNLKNMEKI